MGLVPLPALPQVAIVFTSGNMIGPMLVGLGLVISEIRVGRRQSLLRVYRLQHDVRGARAV